MTFIAIEGIDACGKSTQIKLLAKSLNASTYRFPNDDSPTGKLIRAHLHKEWGARSRDGAHLPQEDALMFQCLHFVNRLEMAMEIMQAQHTLKKDIVSDRYVASAIVYGGADGLDVDYLIATQRWLPQPDLNILLDIPLERSLERRPEREDRYEENKDFLKDVMARYIRLWAHMIESNPGGWVIINGDRPTEEVHKDIVETVTAYADKTK